MPYPCAHPFQYYCAHLSSVLALLYLTLCAVALLPIAPFIPRPALAHLYPTLCVPLTPFRALL
ncbi:hypothetical protein B0H11DRAFT_2243437 [Mycena galericulata]|nr:hypothetical protein B0H11DRAFT_2243437 [Mycena galericulata]